MEIYKVLLKNIKSFVEVNEFQFDNTSHINTISGVNGAGKTTLFKSILLAQRVFFFDQLGDSELQLSLEKDLLSYLSLINSEIKIVFKLIDRQDFFPTFSVLCTTRLPNSLEWELKCEDADRIEILKYWNVKNPQKIIVYVDSNRTINENNFSHEGISLKSSAQGDDLAIDYIFYPDRLFSSIYERIIKD